jgi:hypothetical protein
MATAAVVFATTAASLGMQAISSPAGSGFNIGVGIQNYTNEKMIYDSFNPKDCIGFECDISGTHDILPKNETNFAMYSGKQGFSLGTINCNVIASVIWKWEDGGNALIIRVEKGSNIHLSQSVTVDYQGKKVECKWGKRKETDNLVIHCGTGVNFSIGIAIKK